jgi:hypothetical protein
MIGWDVGRVTTSASADAVEVGGEGPARRVLAGTR